MFYVLTIGEGWVEEDWNLVFLDAPLVDVSSYFDIYYHETEINKLNPKLQ